MQISAEIVDALNNYDEAGDEDTLISDEKTEPACEKPERSDKKPSKGGGYFLLLTIILICACVGAIINMVIVANTAEDED